MLAVEITSELYAALRRPNGWQSVQHFCQRIAPVTDKGAILEGLLATFDERSYTVHEVACAILWTHEIPYTRNLVSDLPGILDHWDVSVEELPFYLDQACGRQPVERALAPISEAQSNNSLIKQKVETMRYWLRARPEEIQERKAEWLQKLCMGDRHSARLPWPGRLEE